MNIAVDARELAGRRTGVGRYLASLLDAWADDADARRHDWRFYAHEAVTLPPYFAGGLRKLPGRGGTRWEQARLGRALRDERPDVLFAPGYTAPLTTPAPVALTIHDVSFAAHPEWFGRVEGLRRRVLTGWSARRARVVLTDSQFSGGEIRRLIGVPASRIRVIPLGLPRGANAAPSGKRAPVVLYVGSIFERRHVDTLITVFATKVAPLIPASRLEIVGDNRLRDGRTLAAALSRIAPELASRVRVRSYVDEATLAALYAEAQVFAFLSEYEGFGLTPLEALAAGVPPVVLDTPVAREVYGGAARYVPASLAPEPLAEALVELLTDAAARSRVMDQRDAVLARYDWKRTAADTLRAIGDAAGV